MQARRIVFLIYRFTLIALLVALGACTTETPSGVVGAATTPLSDLNLIRSKIPPVLLEAYEAPYEVPDDQSCEALAASIAELDEVLEPNGKEADAEKKESLVAKGGSKASEATVDALRNTVEGLVPFRGWVRKLSGAERYSKLVADSVVAGLIRRGFLRGIKVARKCP